MEQNQTGLSYFRIKTEYTKEQENGTLQKTKIEELVLATKVPLLFYPIFAYLKRYFFNKNIFNSLALLINFCIIKLYN